MLNREPARLPRPASGRPATYSVRGDAICVCNSLHALSSAHGRVSTRPIDRSAAVSVEAVASQESARMPDPDDHQKLQPLAEADAVHRHGLRSRAYGRPRPSLALSPVQGVARIVRRGCSMTRALRRFARGLSGRVRTTPASAHRSGSRPERCAASTRALGAERNRLKQLTRGQTDAPGCLRGARTARRLGHRLMAVTRRK